MYRFIVLPIVSALIFTGCSPASPTGTPFGSAQDKPDSVVLASTTFLADITRNIAGDRITVESLLPIGADPHSYQPTPRDAARIADSKLLIVNGADYEHFLDPLLENAGGEREVVEASAGLPIRAEEPNPHLWLDPNFVITYVENIRKGLTHLNPDGINFYQSNADAYVAQLKDLDGWIIEQVSQIPVEKRLLVTNHEALEYFSARYGFTLIGAIVPSVSTGASPSAGQMADLIDQIKSSGAPAIFLDEVENSSLAQQIADETGIRVVTDLHLESLTDGPPAATYIDMMKYNVSLIVEALK